MRQRGFTLVELIMVILLIGIMSALGSTMISDSFTTSKLVDAQDKSGDELRYALDRVAREVREVHWNGTQYDVSSTLSAGATSITFTRSIGGTTTTVAITKSGTQLNLAYTVGGTTTSSTLADGVSAFSLSFMESDGSTATTSASSVRYVGVTLTATDPTSGQSLTQRTRVTLRNS